MVMACTPVLSAAPAVPTLDPGTVNQIIAQTAEAASTQTAAAVPTSTPTETFTPMPHMTNTLQPTITAFVYNTPTAFVIPPPTITSTLSNKDYLCEVLNSPTDGTIYSPRLEFKVRWRLKNVGRLKWDINSVDFVFDYGDKFYKTSGYDLGKTIDVGYVAEIFVEMVAPKDPGTYTSHWSLRAGNEKFCKVSFAIGVK